MFSARLRGATRERPARTDLVHYAIPYGNTGFEVAEI